MKNTKKMISLEPEIFGRLMAKKTELIQAQGGKNLTYSQTIEVLLQC